MKAYQDTGNNLRRDSLLLALVVAPFFLNDFAFIAAGTVVQWLVADYGSKFVALGIIFFVPRLRLAVLETLPIKRSVGEGVLLVCLCTAILIFADKWHSGLTGVYPEQFILFRYPKIEPAALYWFDLTVGLALTAVSEEFVFRGVLGAVMKRYTSNTVLIVLVPSLIFALIHWGSGLGLMAFAFFAGIALMALFLRTGSVLPGIAAHYLINLADFA